MSQNKKSTNLIIAYDGDCPFCQNYITILRLRELNIDTQLIDLRNDPDLVKLLINKNMNPNDGMYVEMDGAEYYGADAMAVLSMMTTSRSILNKIFKWCFQNKKRGKIVYSLLKTGRAITLKILNRSQL